MCLSLVSVNKTQSSVIYHSFEFYTEPHTSVNSVHDFRTGGRWLDPRLGQYFFRELIRVHSFIIAVNCFDNCYVGKQSVAWEEYCA